jgi:DNA-binding transcriptional LysR family regulator
MRLEAELDLKLFERSRRGVWLTMAGSAFLVEVKRTLMQADLATTIARRVAAGGSSRLNISFVDPALYRILPTLLVEQRRAFPEVEVRLYERGSHQQMTGLLEGTFDLAIVFPTPELMEGGDQLTIERSRPMAVVPLDSPLANRPYINLADLADQPMIMAPLEASPTWVSAILAAFRNAGFAPWVTQEAAESATRLNLVAAGLGCSLVPWTAKLSGRSDLYFIPIIDWPSNLYYELALAWQPRHLLPAADAFIALTKACISAQPHCLGVISS